LEVSLNRKQQLGLQTYIVIFLHTADTWFHNPPHGHQCLEELAGCPHASPPENSLWLSVCLLQATYTRHTWQKHNSIPRCWSFVSWKYSNPSWWQSGV
jgi:hypothetical protein